jgi:hypothetical protein
MSGNSPEEYLGIYALMRFSPVLYIPSFQEKMPETVRPDEKLVWRCKVPEGLGNTPSSGYLFVVREVIHGLNTGELQPLGLSAILQEDVGFKDAEFLG